MNLHHIFVELGLTDTNLALAEVTSIAVVRTDHKGKNVAAYADDIKVKGTVPLTVEQLYEGMASVILNPYPNKYVVVTQHSNVYKQLLGSNSFPGKPWLDIGQLAWPLGYSDMISSRDLDTLCKHFEFTNAAPDTTAGDCEVLSRVYWALMKRYKAALTGEEVIREIGGESLAGIRKWIGF